MLVRLCKHVTFLEGTKSSSAKEYPPTPPYLSGRFNFGTYTINVNVVGNEEKGDCDFVARIGPNYYFHDIQIFGKLNNEYRLLKGKSKRNMHLSAHTVSKPFDDNNFVKVVESLISVSTENTSACVAARYRILISALICGLLMLTIIDCLTPTF
uniref:Uncharacterized protein n=1 Tax=Glossina austeni TaxID=7395 RepID=A0A1A9VMK1_GLOAU